MPSLLGLSASPSVFSFVGPLSPYLAAPWLPLTQDHKALFQLTLDDEDLGRINEVLSKGRLPRGDCYQWERGVGDF